MSLIRYEHLSPRVSLLAWFLFPLRLVRAFHACAILCQNRLAASDLGCERDRADADDAICACSDQQHLQAFASCISHHCHQEAREAAWSEIETKCTRQNAPLALSRDRFLDDAASCSWPDCLSNPACSWFDCMSDPSPSQKKNITLTFSLVPPTTKPTSSRVPTTSTTWEISTSTFLITSSPPPPTSTAPSSPRPGHQSDKVAIAVGLGIGIPALLIALLTFIFTCRWPLPWLRSTVQGRARGRRLQRLNSASVNSVNPSDTNYGTFSDDVDDVDDDTTSSDPQSLPHQDSDVTIEQDIADHNVHDAS